MKNYRFIFALLALAPSTFSAEVIVSGDFAVTSRGAHSSVWSRSIQEKTPSGRVVTRTRSYTELGGGLNYWSAEQNAYLPSTSEIEILNGFGVARHGQMKVTWSPNANTAGAIDVETSDGKRFRSHVLGLALTDGKTGASFFFATIKDCIGEVAGNQVIFRQAFEGFSADLVYTYTPGGMEQDLVIHQDLPDPTQPPWNLADVTNLRFECYTELLEAPEASVTATSLNQEENPALRALMTEPSFTDVTLNFGSTLMGSGIAFPSDGGAPTPVAKAYEIREGRRMLIEKIDYSAMKAHVAGFQAGALPQDRVARMDREAVQGARGIRKSPLPRAPALLARGNPPAQPMRMAKKIPNLFHRPGLQTASAERPEPGYVADYSLVNTANITLLCDRTYYVSSPLTITGTNYAEGGCVVKYAPTNNASITLSGPLICLTGPYRPLVLTARDDHYIGEQIGTNALSGLYASKALSLDNFSPSTAQTLKYIFIRYAQTGIHIDYDAGSGHSFSHIQLVHCGIGLNPYNTSYSLRNALFYDVLTNFSTGSYNSTGKLEHITVDLAGYFNESGGAQKQWLYATNCLLVGITNQSFGYVTNSSAVVSNLAAGSSVFQTAGEGAHYLAANSAHRDVGTSTIDPTLAQELRSKTTYPPVVLGSQWLTVDTTFSPQAQRDTDTPDIGYHYDPLDVCIGSIAFSNATITVLAGTAVGIYSTNGSSYGLGFFDNANLVSEGSPTNLNRFARFNTVQEHANTAWSLQRPPSIVPPFVAISTKPTARFRFTQFSSLADEISHLYSYSDLVDAPFQFRDCQLHGGSIYITIKPALAVTNCLFERVNLVYDDGGNRPVTNLFQNSLFQGGSYTFYNSFTNLSVFRDNFFNNVDYLEAYSIDGDYNGYNTTNSTRVATGAHDVIIGTTNVTFDTGALGRFYLKTNSTLIDAGSRTNASQVGFYHMTTLTNGTRELTNRLDISFHYVATTNGVPFDTDGDGIIDLLEDLDGDGVFDAGETDWQTYDSLFGISGAPGLQVFTPLR
jgi:hypothetical protein